MILIVSIVVNKIFSLFKKIIIIIIIIIIAVLQLISTIPEELERVDRIFSPRAAKFYTCCNLRIFLSEVLDQTAEQ